MFNTRELCVDVEGQSLGCLLAEPDELSPRPALLLNFASDRTTTLQQPPYDITPRMFVAKGHRALSFDLPCHGERASPDRLEGISGFCAEWVSGRDVLSGFVDEGRTVIDAVISGGLAEPGRIFVSGTSRGGYCALRLMAADRRIAAGAAFAPVTDWRVLQEFAAIKDQPEVARVALDHYAPALAGRAVWLAIGNRDARVSTECCLSFVAAIAEAETAQARSASSVVLHVVPESGHAVSDAWRRRGGEYLVAMADPAGAGRRSLDGPCLSLPRCPCAHEQADP